MKDKQTRAKYTLEFKLEAVRPVNEGQPVPVTAKVLGIPKATLGNWVREAAKGTLKGAGDKPVTAEQMEIARLRAECHFPPYRHHGRADGHLDLSPAASVLKCAPHQARTEAALGRRRFEMFQYRSVLAQIRRGASD